MTDTTMVRIQTSTLIYGYSNLGVLVDRLDRCAAKSAQALVARALNEPFAVSHD